MRELTVQGGNDTLQASDRGAIKSEMDQLSSEISRISGTTQFNGITLLNGSLSAKGTDTNFNNLGATNLTGFTTRSVGRTSALRLRCKPRFALAPSVPLALPAVATAGSLVINGIDRQLRRWRQRLPRTSPTSTPPTGLGANGSVTASLDATTQPAAC